MHLFSGPYRPQMRLGPTIYGGYNRHNRYSFAVRAAGPGGAADGFLA